MSKRLPPVESLRILEACVRHASFTRAAEEIGVTPAAISLRMRNLEVGAGHDTLSALRPEARADEAALTLAARVAEAVRLMRVAVEDCRGAAQPLRLTAVPSFATRWLAPRLARYHALADATRIEVDCSVGLRAVEDFDLAIRTGRGDWPGFDVTRLFPVEATPMLSPALAATARLSAPADLARLPLLPHDDWLLWFREAGTNLPRLRFCADEYATHDLDASAAMEGTGVALLSPTLFAAPLREGKLIRPFTHVMRGPNWHHLLTKPGDTRPAVQSFRAWLQGEVSAAAHVE